MVSLGQIVWRLRSARHSRRASASGCVHLLGLEVPGPRVTIASDHKLGGFGWETPVDDFAVLVGPEFRGIIEDRDVEHRAIEVLHRRPEFRDQRELCLFSLFAAGLFGRAILLFTVRIQRPDNAGKAIDCFLLGLVQLALYNPSACAVVPLVGGQNIPDSKVDRVSQVLGLQRQSEARLKQVAVRASKDDNALVVGLEPFLHDVVCLALCHARRECC